MKMKVIDLCIISHSTLDQYLSMKLHRYIAACYLCDYTTAQCDYEKVAESLLVAHFVDAHGSSSVPSLYEEVEI